MADLFDSPRIADLILAVLLLEAVLLRWRRAKTGRGPRLRAVLPFLASGACLALALRCALTEAPWPWMSAALMGAGVAHLTDLALREGSSATDP